MHIVVKDSTIWGLKDGTRRAKDLNACCRRPESQHHFPAINQSIISPEQTVGSSKLKVTLWWAPPSRGMMYVCVCETDWRALRRAHCTALVAASHTHTHFLLGRIKVCSCTYKNSNTSTGEREEFFFLFFPRSHLPEQQTPSVWPDRAAESLDACVWVCVIILTHTFSISSL